MSVPANIAEGSQRQQLKEYLQSLHVASTTSIWLSNLYCGDDGLTPIVAVQVEAAKMLHGLIQWVES